ncbi:MAG TPA: Os1348 family NHLP clan protein [Bacteroidota bacterium]
MSQEAVEKVLGRLLTDDIFRNRARESLRMACLEEGYLLSDEESRMVGRLDLVRIGSLAESLDSGIKRFAVRSRQKQAPGR